MKFSKLDLLTLLISLFLLSSCKDSSTLGLNIDPANAVQGILVDTVTVTSRTVADVPAPTYSAGSGIGRYPLGEMRDDIFGTTTASLAMSVNLPNGSIVFGTNPVIDSAILVLPFYQSPAGVTQYRGREFYGDSTAVYNINVSQLTDNLSTQTTWLSNKVYASGTPFGTFAGRISPTTSVKVVDIVTGARDTVKTNVPQIRIKLDQALIKSKILGLDSLSLSSNAKFNTAFKGLKVTASTSGKNGGIMMLDFTANASLEIHYKQQNATTPANVDTLVSLFPINTATNAVAATVTHDYSNTPVADQLKDQVKEPQVTYIQSMSGVRSQISFPYLKTLIASIGSKIVINKAELVIDSSNPTDSVPFKIPPRIALYTTDIAQQRINVQDNNPYSSGNTTGDIRTATSGIPFGGFYDYTKNSYTFVVTNFIQDLVDGKTTDHGTYLGPTNFTGVSLFPFANTAGRVVIGSFNNTNNRKIRLNIYYVKTGTK